MALVAMALTLSCTDEGGEVVGGADTTVVVGATTTSAADSVAPCTPSTVATSTPSTSATVPPTTTTASLTASTTTSTPSTPSTSAPTTSAPTTTAAPTTTTAPTTASTTSTTALTTTSTTRPPDPALISHQQRLSDLGYWLGTVDGYMGPNTAHAITAFQKAEGLARTGTLDAATVERLAVATTPSAQSGSGTVLEIDRARQILLVAVNGHVTRIYDIATGTAATPTPAGHFTIYSEIDGYRYAPLGVLYRPKYFNGGIALHGYTSVPSQPASHGCVRLTYAAMDNLWASGRAPIGTPVWVY